MEFNGERLARRGIVVVTINYRLNVFGFLAHPELTAENPDFPTNFGHLDQIFGLQWVKRNIAAFGGDPNNITIGGQSAGGRSVQVLLTSPLTKDLFHKAIVMSGIRYGGYGGVNAHGLNRTLSQAESDGEDFFAHAGIKSLEEARKLDAQVLIEKFRDYAGIGSGLGPGVKMWSPVIDGKVQTGHFSEMIIKNKRHMVPLMMSNTSTESWDSPRVNSMEELEALAQEMFGDSAEKFLEAVKADTLDESIKNATFCPMELGMRLYFEATSKVRPELDNWGAVFDGEIPGWDNPGTFHSSDLWFVFESLASCWRPFTGKHYDLARHVSNYVSNFIKSGNPNGQDIDGTPMAEWKPYREAKGQMRYGHPSGQLPDSSVTPVTKFMTDYYLSQY
jgi:para-nitrobenzyl esterase